jgi:ferritin
MNASALRQKSSLKEEIIDIINKQIAKEAHSAAVYQAMSSWLHTQGLLESAKFFRKQSDEERMHMYKFVDYIQDMGGHALSPEIVNVKNEFSGLREVLDTFLDSEIKITESINNIADLSLKLKDFQTLQFLGWFLEEQKEEEDNARRTIEIYELIGTELDGLFKIDKYIGKLAE